MTLETLANIAGILTACCAVPVSIRFAYFHFRNRKKLEAYLKREKKLSKNKGQRTLLHLMANLGLTESEILQASFSSKHINRVLASDSETNRAVAILLNIKKRERYISSRKW